MKGGLKYFSLLIVVLVSCVNRSSQEALNQEEYSHYLELGQDISTRAQSALLANVSSAMKEGGSLYAIEFCNLNASSITDSLNEACNCEILRVSNRNRNPHNALATGEEQQLWDLYATHYQNPTSKDTLIVMGDEVVYYKPVYTALETCLLCHGLPADIDPAAMRKVHQLYPDDKAVGYRLNELRGLWKIIFPIET